MTPPPVAILAGGLATRLGPITRTIPKSLISVAGEPFLAHQLRLLKARGAARVVLLIGHMGEQIEAFAGDGSAFGLQIAYARDGRTQRGTGGALRAALPLLGDMFFVTYGDSYLDVDLTGMRAVKEATQCPGVMAVLHNKDRWDFSNVVFDGARVRRHDKKARGQPGVEWIDYGISLFESKLLADWPHPDPFDLSALTGALAAEGRLAGFSAQRRFYEIGKPEGLAETESFLKSQRE